MIYFLGTCSLALTLAVVGAACNGPSTCDGADCPCVQDCSCNDGTTQQSVADCGPTVCVTVCADHGGAVDGGDGG